MPSLLRCHTGSQRSGRAAFIGRCPIASELPAELANRMNYGESLGGMPSWRFTDRLSGATAWTAKMSGLGGGCAIVRWRHQLCGLERELYGILVIPLDAPARHG